MLGRSQKTHICTLPGPWVLLLCGVRKTYSGGAPCPLGRTLMYGLHRCFFSDTMALLFHGSLPSPRSLHPRSSCNMVPAGGSGITPVRLIPAPESCTVRAADTTHLRRLHRREPHLRCVEIVVATLTLYISLTHLFDSFSYIVFAPYRSFFKNGLGTFEYFEYCFAT